MKPYLTVNGIFSTDRDRRARQRTVRTECETIVFQKCSSVTSAELEWRVESVQAVLIAGSQRIPPEVP